VAADNRCGIAPLYPTGELAAANRPGHSRRHLNEAAHVSAVEPKGIDNNGQAQDQYSKTHNGIIGHSGKGTVS
jgi:hypothetical protein